MREENPYSTIIQTMRTDSDSRAVTSWLTGLVTSTAPLKVKIGENELSGAMLLCNIQLLPNTEAATLTVTSGTLNGTTDCTEGAITAMQVTGGTLAATGVFGGVLVVGDRVALLQSPDQQQYIVLCKVVTV